MKTVTIVTSGIAQGVFVPVCHSVLLSYELSFRLTLSQVLYLLDFGDPGPTIGNIAVIQRQRRMQLKATIITMHMTWILLQIA